MVDRNEIRKIVHEIYEKDKGNVDEVVSEYLSRKGITDVTERLKELIISIALKEIKYL